MDVASLGIAVNGVRKTRGQRVVITCESEGDRESLSQAISKSKTNITASPLKPRKPLIKILGVASDLNDSQIPPALINQNKKLVPGADPGELRVVRRVRGRNSSLFNIILEVTPKIWASIRDRNIHLGYQVVPAVDQSPVVQC